jgi:transposase
MVSDPNRVTVGIDAAVVANHQVAIRGSTGGEVIAEDFAVSPNLAGLEKLTGRLSEHPGALVVAEPTGMSWLALGHAVNDAECGFALVESRHTSKLRGAIAGKNKTDVIDADMLAASTELFGLSAGPLPTAGQVALRRAVRRRHRLTAEAHNTDLRLWSIASWAFPDLWKAMGESHRLARAVLGQWPRLDQLGRAHIRSVAALCKTYLRDGGDPEQRAERIREAARGWARFWTGRLDLDALAWEITELLDDIDIADRKVEEASQKAARLWRSQWGSDDLLVSVSGIGPVTAPVVRAYLGDASQFRTSKQAAAFVGLNPSNWESGLMVSPSRPITKAGPPELRLAFYQAANVARQYDPQLAAFYQRMMCERGHHHIQATCATARKLVCRVWATLTSGEPYDLRDVDGNPVDRVEARRLAARYAVPEHVRRRARARNKPRRGRLSG